MPADTLRHVAASAPAAPAGRARASGIATGDALTHANVVPGEGGVGLEDPSFRDTFEVVESGAVRDGQSVPLGFLDDANRARTEQEVLDVHSRWCQRILQGDRCSIAFRNDSDEIRFHSAHGDTGTNAGARFRLAGSVADFVVRHRRTVLVPDLSRLRSEGCRVLAGLGYRALVMTPLATRERCFGLIAVSYRRALCRDSHDFQTLEVIGQCLAGQLLIAEQVARLSEMAHNDALTGARNRRFFATASSESWGDWTRSGRPFGLIAFDIDHFKRINDTHGHLVGDQILAVFAERLRRRLREGDVLARLGGEEFAVLAADTSRSALHALGRRLIDAIRSHPFACEGGTHAVTASAGVAIPEATDAAFEDVARRADAALYAAKRAGRDRIFRADADGLDDLEDDRSD